MNETISNFITNINTAINSAKEESGSTYIYTNHAKEIKKIPDKWKKYFGSTIKTNDKNVGQLLIKQPSFRYIGTPTDLQELFRGCTNLTEVDFSQINTSSVTNIQGLVQECSKLQSTAFLSQIDTSNLTNMQMLFQGCTSLQTVTFPTTFNTSKVTTMQNLFRECSSLTTVTFPNTWDTSKVYNFGYMFLNCAKLQSVNLTYFNTTALTDMYSMFSGCSSLTSLTFPNTFALNGKTVAMSGIFNGCSKLTSLDLSNWGSITTTSSFDNMFKDCSSLTTLTLPTAINFATAGTSGFSYYFGNCKKLTSLDLSSWTASLFTRTDNMFYGCSALTSVVFPQTVNFSKCDRISCMFQNCTNLTTITIPNFYADAMNNISNLFSGDTKITTLSGTNFLKNLGKGYTSTTANYSNYKLTATMTTLSHDSIMLIINNVYDLNLTYNVSSGGTLKTQGLNFGSTNLAKLTSEEKAIATAKGWTLS